MYCRPIDIEFLFAPGCENTEPALALLREVLQREECPAEIRVRRIETEEDAIRYRFRGSPTILIDGVDIEGPSRNHLDKRPSCRVFGLRAGRSGVPDASVIREALHTHPAKRRPSAPAMRALH
ncbi:MAG: DUF2703 domain-containing protein [Gemmatimonadales bacterium]